MLTREDKEIWQRLAERGPHLALLYSLTQERLRSLWGKISRGHPFGTWVGRTAW